MKITMPAASAPESMIFQEAEAKEEFNPRTLPHKEYLKYISGDLYPLLNKIVIAESGWKPDIKNRYSTASGLFQFLDGTFKSYCIVKYKFAESMTQKNDPYIQMDCATKMIQNGGLSHWNASKHNWSK